MPPLPTPVCTDPNDGLFALQNPWVRRLARAIGKGDVAAVDALLDEHRNDPSLGDVNAVSPGEEGTHGNALHKAVEEAQVAVLERLLPHPGLDLDSRDPLLRTVLHRAVHLNHPEAARLTRMLLDAGVHVPIAETSPLIGWGDRSWTMVQTMLRLANAHTATVLDVLHARDQVDLNALDPVGNTLLHLALHPAVRSIHEFGLPFAPVPRPVVLWLLAHGADPLAPRRDGKTPLDLSADLQEDEPWTVDVIAQAVLRLDLHELAGTVPTAGRSRPRL